MATSLLAGWAFFLFFFILPPWYYLLSAVVKTGLLEAPYPATSTSHRQVPKLYPVARGHDLTARLRPLGLLNSTSRALGIGYCASVVVVVPLPPSPPLPSRRRVRVYKNAAIGLRTRPTGDGRTQMRQPGHA
ncbi:hypothetical protein GGR56DRAFT_647413 [Xylariaceae sp. FL0804]|nr:hypothetical protein GGR56DRAFT_647413 [Xylariaceae sp. FL0804]